MSHGDLRPTMKVVLYWDDRAKHWNILYQLMTGSGLVDGSHSALTTNPLDIWAADQLLSAMAREMESWLPF